MSLLLDVLADLLSVSAGSLYLFCCRSRRMNIQLKNEVYQLRNHLHECEWRKCALVSRQFKLSVWYSTVRHVFEHLTEL